MDTNHLKLATRAELYLCLSRAFLAPMREGDFDALRNDFSADVRDLHAELHLTDEAQISRLFDSLASLPDHATLLKTYSRLFLAPPAPALFNLAFHLDGALMGNSGLEIERLYETYGLERDTDFHEASDHLALYLQFLAWVFARAQEQLDAGQESEGLRSLADAQGSIICHARPAMRRLILQIEKAEGELDLHGVFGEITRLTKTILDKDAAAIGAILPAPEQPIAAVERPSVNRAPMDTPDAMVSCPGCGKGFMAGGELATMITVLEAQGLATDHMRMCPDCRTGAMGLSPMEAPRLKRAS
jgi:putative dimethyl sulfoxide reductase chaperone